MAYNKEDLYKMMASNRPQEFNDHVQNLEEQSTMSMDEEDMNENNPEVDKVMENLPKDEGGFMPRRGVK